MLILHAALRLVPSVLFALAIAPAARAQSCAGDLNDDGVINGADLGQLLSSWGRCVACAADTNSDGRVDGLDLGVLLGNWGECVTVPAWATLVEAQPDPAVVTDASLRAAIAATGYAWRVRDTATQVELLLVPPGTFQMGCSASTEWWCLSAEDPVHTVTLTNAFYMGRYEVTQAQWTASMGSNPSFFRTASAQVPDEQVPSRPVERVSWDTIQGFLSATGMRLPTEAEWEYAYRAGAATAFHSMPGYSSGTNDDNQLGTIAWFTSNSASQTRAVGQKPGNGFGLHDMSGNVFEWVSDRYSGTYYASSPSVNPPGPSSGPSRVLRGGGWNGYSIDCRSSLRFGNPPSTVDSSYGFRVARAP